MEYTLIMCTVVIIYSTIMMSYLSNTITKLHKRITTLEEINNTTVIPMAKIVNELQLFKVQQLEKGETKNANTDKRRNKTDH